MIDLTDIGTATQATLGANNVLTVDEGGGGSVTINLSPSTNYGDDAFTVSSDGNGGTDVGVALGVTPVDLGFTPGGDSQASCINNAGEIVGSTIGSENSSQGVLWQNGSVTYLGQNNNVDSQDQFGATAINDFGEIAGVGLYDATPVAETWQNGKITQLTQLGYSEAFGINDAGRVVGWTGSANGLLAYVWQDGKATDLGGYDGEAYAINNNGQIVGVAETTSHLLYAVLWQNGNIVDLGTLGLDDSDANDINGAGQVVGWAYDDTGYHQAFLWEDDTMTDLGGSNSLAYAINNVGQIVGSNGGAAVLWQDGAMIDLNGLVSAGSGWVLSTALAINDEGQIVGEGTRNGVLTGFELTLPAAYLVGK